MGLLYDDSLFAFVLITLVLGGGAAWLTGRAVARSWQPAWLVVAYCLILGLPVRFLHFALGGGTLLSLTMFITNAAIVIAIGLIAYRMAQASTMVNQYPWLYERKGPFGWSDKGRGKPAE
jgi:hypothetical protein